MNERDAFIRAVCEAPDDDTPRLVYADWLQEHGDEARAEFVRVQCELAKLEPPPDTTGCCDVCGAIIDGGTPHFPDCRWAQLRAREGELFRAHWLAFLKPRLDGAIPFRDQNYIGWSVRATKPVNHKMSVRFRRGFVESVLCSATNWHAFANALYWHPEQVHRHHCPSTANPLREVMLTTWPGSRHQVNVPDELWVIPDEWGAGGRGEVVAFDDREEKLRFHLGERWPGITFHLPTT